MPTTTSSTLVSTILANRTKRLPAALPWGSSLRGLTVSEFAKSFEKHLPLIRSKLNDAPPEQTLRAICNELSSSSLMFDTLSLMVRQARTDMKRKKTSKKLAASYKRQQKEEDLNAQEERTDAEEQSDPVAAAVNFLLGLIGM